MDINEIFERAEMKSRVMTPDNSAPLMTHDITEESCNGLADCPVHPTNLNQGE